MCLFTRFGFVFIELHHSNILFDRQTHPSMKYHNDLMFDVQMKWKRFLSSLNFNCYNFVGFFFFFLFWFWFLSSCVANLFVDFHNLILEFGIQCYVTHKCHFSCITSFSVFFASTFSLQRYVTSFYIICWAYVMFWFFTLKLKSANRYQHWWIPKRWKFDLVESLNVHVFCIRR